MTTLRTLGVVAVVFVVSLPIIHAINNGLPGKWTQSIVGGDESEQEKDDPVVDALCLKGLMYAGSEQYLSNVVRPCGGSKSR